MTGAREARGGARSARGFFGSSGMGRAERAGARGARGVPAALGGGPREARGGTRSARGVGGSGVPSMHACIPKKKIRQKELSPPNKIYDLAVRAAGPRPDASLARASHVASLALQRASLLTTRCCRARVYSLL
jgi:hypothetical protein